MDNIKELARMVAHYIKGETTKTKPYDTAAKVKRIEGNTAYVEIPGGVSETPVKLTIDAKKGDTVQVRVANGTAWLVGNRTAPPTDDAEALIAKAVAKVAETKAVSAEETAEQAGSQASTALAQAQAAKQIADDTEQHFWFQETGLDTGAHITEVTQDEWEDISDPNYHSGGNLLARSNGIAVRDGMTELAQFSASQAVIGDTSSTHTVLENNALRFYDGSYTPIDITYSYDSGQDARHGTVMASHTSAWSQSSYDAKPGVASTAMAAQSSGSGTSMLYVKADAVNGDTAHIEIDHQDCIKSEIDSGTNAPKTTIYGQADCTGDLDAVGDITDGGGNVLSNKADRTELSNLIKTVSKSQSTGSISAGGYKNQAVTPTAPTGKSLIGCVSLHVTGTNSSYCQLIGFYINGSEIDVQMKNTSSGSVTWTIEAIGLYM